MSRREYKVRRRLDVKRTWGKKFVLEGSEIMKMDQSNTFLWLIVSFKLDQLWLFIFIDEYFAFQFCFSFSPGMQVISWAKSLDAALLHVYNMVLPAQCSVGTLWWAVTLMPQTFTRNQTRDPASAQSTLTKHREHWAWECQHLDPWSLRSHMSPLSAVLITGNPLPQL